MVMKLSTRAWNKSSSIYQAIINHPFNQELMQGILAKDKFACYIEQDILYLQDFARCHAIMASKVSLEYVRAFLKYSDYTFAAEQEVVHQFFKKAFGFKETGLVTSATLSYTSYMLRSCLNDSLEVGMATLLPCFWIYREVGNYIEKHADKSNPYYRWIETYASEGFSNTVDEAIGIFDMLADNTTENMRQRMLDAFYKSACLEWHFWNDAYKIQSFDDVKC
jgi:thiaminase/transcriptional activator TenA